MTHPNEHARHHPPDRATLRAAAIELRTRGLTPRDVGAALGIGESAARELLGLPLINALLRRQAE